MRYTILIVLLAFLVIFQTCQSIEIIIQDQNEDFENYKTDQDYTGNSFSALQLACIKGNISLAENQYGPTQLASIAAFIAQAMNKFNSLYKYSVYVFDNSTTSAAETVDIDSGRHLWWIRYGKYNLTYVMDIRAACRNMGASGAPSQFGQQVVKSDRDFITQVVDNSAIYRGDSVLDASSYIYTKLSQKYGRYYKVVVAKPNTNLGFYECRTGEFWAYFKNYTDRKWSYYIVRTQK